jgi:hypothetical protein
MIQLQYSVDRDTMRQMEAEIASNKVNWVVCMCEQSPLVAMVTILLMTDMDG